MTRDAPALPAGCEDSLRTFFNGSEDAFCILEIVCDAQDQPVDFRWRQTNPAFERHTGIAGAAGDLASVRLPDLDAGCVQLFGRVALSGQSTRSIEYSAATGRWFDMEVFAFGDPALRQVGLLFRDITERQRTQEALRAANARLVASDRHKDQFLAMLAHELRNPLAAIANVARLLDHAPGIDPRHHDVLRRQTAMLSGMVDDLLDVSRITRGLSKLKQGRLDLVAVAKTALDSVAAAAAARQQHIRSALPGGPLPVMGDDVRLEQIIVNLLTNAIKYSDRGATIQLMLTADERETRLAVVDAGIGIAPELLGSIFDLFGQAERGLDRAEGGLGIGLTVVKHLVELHGGTIEAHSAGPGHGSEFVVTLPPPLAVVPVDEPLAMSAAAGGGSRVLVVDDNQDIAATLAELLQLAGYDVSVAHDGRAALAQAKATRPHAVLLDIGLPGWDGYEVARRLRALAGTEPPIIAALTGYGQPADRERVVAAGFDRHFVKPVDIVALETFLAQALAPITAH